MFTVTGKLKGKEKGRTYSVTYKDGKFSGSGLDEYAVVLAATKAKELEGKFVGTVGQETIKNHLSEPLSALAILLDYVFEKDVKVTGDIPEPDPVPDGAVI